MQLKSFWTTVKYIKHLSTIPHYERSAWLIPKPQVTKSNSLELSKSICLKLHQIPSKEVETYKKWISGDNRQNLGRTYKFSSSLKGNISVMLLNCKGKKRKRLLLLCTNKPSIWSNYDYSTKTVERKIRLVDM